MPALGGGDSLVEAARAHGFTKRMPTVPSTILDYARLADAVYAADPQVEGWQRIAFQPGGAGLRDAFQGAAFRRGAELVLACKGTSQAADIVTDLKLGVGMNTVQFAAAERFLAGVAMPAGASPVVTGHSLGGAIAQIVGNRHRLPFATFNAPGVGLISRNLDEMAVTGLAGTAALRTVFATLSAVRHPMQAGRDLGSLFYRVKGVNFRIGKDVVGCIGVHYGKVVEIPYDGGALDVKVKHQMATVIRALEASPIGQRTLGSFAA